MQTSYAIAPATAVAGMQADLGGNVDVISKAAEVAIPFGVFVVQGTGAEQAKLPVNTGEVTGRGMLGIALGDFSKEYDASGHAIGDAVPILRGGRAWVVCEEAMALGDSVFVRFATGAGGSQKGAVRNDADTASAVALQGAVVTVASSGAGVCQVEFNKQTA